MWYLEFVMQMLGKKRDISIIIKQPWGLRKKMTTAFLVTPLKNNSIVEEEIFKKGRQTFSVIKTWGKGVLITESIPNSEMIDGIKITAFKNLKFKEDIFDYKKKLVLPENLSDKDSKELNKLFKSDNFHSWNLKKYGWASNEYNYTVLGDFDSIKVPVNQLTLVSSEHELQILYLTKEQVKNYSENGVPQSVIDELSDSTKVCNPVFDERTSLTVDGKELPDFYERFKIKYDEALKEENYPKFSKSKKIKPADLKYALVNVSWIKRSWYELTIYEDFDFSKLKIHISRDSIFGSDDYVETFSLNYDGLELEFRQNYGADSSEIFIVDSNGNETEFEILEDEDE